jgi:Ca2+-transporting ATPase
MAEQNSLYYCITPEEILERLDSGPDGLGQEQVQERLARFGPNELAPAKKTSALWIFLRQFGNLLIAILIAATVISLLLGEHLDAYVILAIVLACAILGFVQEYRAEKAAAGLQKLAAPTATVIRGGTELLIPARQVVPGDVLVLHTGDRVAADARLLEQVNLQTDESLLTGESTPVSKDVAPLAAPDIRPADQKCMVFGGTVVTYGRGRAVVTATGMETEFGRIARMLTEVSHEQTPLEKRMQVTGRVLSVICLVVAAGVTLLGVFRGHSWLEMLLWGISLAVAAVPESLPAVVTGALAIGTTRMARRRAIVKRLPAVETMGSTTVICTDKTGTLTKNEMTARWLFLDGREIEVGGAGYEPLGEFRDDGVRIDPGADPVLKQAARIAILCNDARLEAEGGGWAVRGDPTEAALLVLGRKAGLDLDETAASFPRVAEIPFSSESTRMTTIHQAPRGFLMCVKGAPESVLPRCVQKMTGSAAELLGDKDREEIMAAGARMGHQALRVMGLAYRPLEAVPEPASEPDRDLVWVGLVGLMDPPRDESKGAVRRCREAGIRVIMITGDHPDTAAAIAREVGLISPRAKSQAVLTGTELKNLNNAQLRRALKKVSVFARVAPEHKLLLVEALKSQGEVVAMTGDGVNDAPALKRADIGVAMGLTGAEVTKETAAMILADDNFATLVGAVEEGRAIFDNIKKYLIFLLSCNLAEIFVLAGAFFIGLPLPLIALQILWVNLTTDGLPALALGVDPKAPDIMKRPPRPPREGIFSTTVTWLLGVISVYLTLILIPLFAWYYYGNPRNLSDPEQVLVQARTMVFITLVLAEMANAFNCRSDRLSLFRVGVFKNHFLVAAVVISLGLMAAVIEVDPLARLFHTVPLRWQDWLLALGLGLTLLPVVELTKLISGRRSRGRPPRRATAEGSKS